LEHQLIAKAAGGDAGALEALLLGRYALLARHVTEQIPASLRSVLSAEDVLQHTFVQAFRSVSSLQSRSSEGLTAWLKTLASHELHHLIELWRAQKRQGPRGSGAPTWSAGSISRLVETLSDSGRSPSGVAARAEAVQALHVAMAVLPDEQRRAVELHCLAGQTLGQTADALNRSPGAVRGMIQRAKRSLKDALGRSSRWFTKR
jgi:RNA polymerase sigma-70 factor (ECF subfamily)